MELIELERLPEREDMLRQVIAGQCLPDGLQRFLAPHVPILGQSGWIAHSVDDGADDLHPRHAGDVGDDVVQLDIHLHQRLLHVLDVRRGVVDQSFSMAQIGTQPDHCLARPEARSQKTVLMQLLQPLRVVDVRFPPGHILHVSSVHQ